MTTGTGDRPIFPLTNERLDKKDLNLISTSVQATINRALGSLFGGSGGLLSRLDYTLTYDTPNPGDVWVALAPFRAAWSEPADVGDPDVFDGGVMTYDPARAAQNETSWDLTPLVGQAVIVWAERYTSNVTADNRAYWQGGTKYAPTLTMESEGVIVAFRLASLPDPGPSAVVIGYIQSSSGWAGNVPTIGGVYFPDSRFLSPGGAGPGRRNWWSLYNPDVAGGGNPGFALGDQLRWILNVISRVIDSEWVFEADGRVNTGATTASYGWQDEPPKGLYQVDAAQDVQDALIAALDERVTVLEGADPTGTLITMAAVLEFRWNAGTVTYDKVVVYSSGSVSSTHVIEVRGATGHGVIVTLTAASGYTIYDVSGEWIGTDGAGGNTPTVQDGFAVLRYPSGTLPGTSLTVTLYAGGTIASIAHQRLKLTVFSGRTPA